MHSSRRLLSPY